MNLIMAAILIGSLQVTAYRSVPQQTDSSPFTTSIGERVTIRGCAVSQDLLSKNGGPFNYGDLLYIEGVGFRFVNDTMNVRNKKHIDLWVPTYQEEKKIGVSTKKVWLVKPAIGD